MESPNHWSSATEWPERRELQQRLRAAMAMRKPDGSLITLEAVMALWDEKKSTAERMLGQRPGNAKLPTPQQIKALADAVGLPEAFFYADFARLDEIVPSAVKALLEAKRDEIAAIERQRELLGELYAGSPEADEVQQLVEREVERGRAHSPAGGRTKRARKHRQDEER